MYTMTKTQLIAHLADQLGVSKKLAAELVNTFIDAIIAGVKKQGEVRIQGFGTFKSSKRKAREGVNPQNPKQKIKIPAMNVVTFKAGSEFKSAVK
jgi:DNA-binding protein HU-beta